MNLEVGYDLPFAVRLTAVPAGDLMRVVVETRDAATEENFRQLEGHVQIWVECALFGAGGGPRLRPQMSSGPLDATKVLAVHDATPGPNGITFEAPGLVCEPAYATVLLHKIFCLAHHFVAIKSVSLNLPTTTSAPRAMTVSRAEASQLPERASLTFGWDDNLDTGADSVALTITFERPLSVPHFEMVTKLLWSWLAQGVQGGYISPPYHPEQFALLASEDPTHAGAEVAWDLSDAEVDVRAFNVLANMLQAFSDRFAKIAEVVLE